MRDRYDYYAQLSDAELEEMARDRAQERNADFIVEEHPAGGTFRAAYTQPSPIEPSEVVYLASAEVADRRLAIIALLWQGDLLAGQP